MSGLRFAVIGNPVGHSRSPEMHAAAYRALGLPHVYEKLPTSEAELADRVAALRAGVYAGLNVTVPYKTDVLALVDEIDSSARVMGAANTLVRVAPDRVRAHNTDGPALVEELARLADLREGTPLKGRDAFRGRSAMVLGTGGAARAAIYALGVLGVSSVVVRARREKRELASVLEAAVEGAGPGLAAPSMTFEALDPAPAEERPDLVAIVQATTAGMDGSGVPGESVADAVAWRSVPRDCVVLDVVYAPPRTVILDRAAARGLVHDSGVGMLARLGALSFELWLGVTPPFDVMRDALVKSLAA